MQKRPRARMVDTTRSLVLVGLPFLLSIAQCAGDDADNPVSTSAGGSDPFGNGGSNGNDAGGSRGNGAGGSQSGGGSGGNQASGGNDTGGSGGNQSSDSGGSGGDGNTGGSGSSSDPETPELSFTAVGLPGARDTTDFAFLPGSTSEFLVTTLGGTLFHYRFNATGITEVGRAEIGDTFTLDGCGLLNVLFDPHFETNRTIYLSRCVELQVTRLSRFTFDSIGAVPGTEAEILTIDEPRVEHPWHRFGSMGFEEDGETLWVLLGDMVVDGLAQDYQRAPGSVLRIVPNRNEGESGFVPARGNAFEADEGDPSIYAYGLRSPWRGTRDRFGRIWVGDVGGDDAEEVNLVVEAGQNFGWDDFEGACPAACDGVTNPIATYGRKSDEPYVLDDPLTEPATRRAIWVGQAYHHDRDRYFGLFTDAVVFGDFFTGWVRRLSVDEAGEVVSDESVGHLTRITSWKTGNDGYMYALTLDARLHRATQVTP